MACTVISPSQIADFGLARPLDEEEGSYMAKHGAMLPIRWLAVESITDHVFNELTDVWAYGVTCWEVFSDGEVPYSNVTSYNLAASIAAGTRLRQPSRCPSAVWQTVHRCWAKDPAARPNFAALMVDMTAKFHAQAQDDDGGSSEGSTRGVRIGPGPPDFNEYEDISKPFGAAKRSEKELIPGDVYLDMSREQEIVDKNHRHKGAATAGKPHGGKQSPSSATPPPGSANASYDDVLMKKDADADDRGYTYLDYVNKFPEI